MQMSRIMRVLVVVFSLPLFLHSIRCEAVVKTESILHSASRRAAAIRNAERFDWAANARDNILERAAPWRRLSHDEIWNLMFGSTITRSWMVWSDGFCPECRQDVRMYTWVVDIWNHPFKVKCPHCKSLFPTNDFEAFYKSGLNKQGIFEASLADRSLLFNQAHPDPQDPKHLFGVDDGEGFVENDQRWRFIGYYLSAGQWRQKIVEGAASLSEAYAVTGDREYSRRAVIVLDRIADLYPSFDFATQGEVYEKRGSNGYVSVWHDACSEIQRLVYAYDQVFDGMKDDSELVAFLSTKSEQTGHTNPKDSVLRIQENIEENIFRDTLSNEHKIKSNFPTTPVAVMTIQAVLEYPENREQILQSLCEIAGTSTVRDGLTGEKGLSGYSTIFPVLFSDVIGRFDALDPTLIDELFQRHPALCKTWRFFIDTWCFETFYPHIGDCGSFGLTCPVYVGTRFHVPVRSASPSAFTFMWRLYQITGDPDYVKVLYRANGYKRDGLPHDLGEKDPDFFQKSVQEIVDREGTSLNPGSVCFQQWGLAILRSGQAGRKALWTVANNTGNHGHLDALNLGLYAYGADLLPDFGYPPVGYGGWTAPKAKWYLETAAHNTVMVDSAPQRRADGRFALWCPGKKLDLVKAIAPQCAGCDVYQRTLLKVDLSDEDFYVIDLFQVVGGSEHAYFLSSNFGEVQVSGFRLHEVMADPFPNMTRNFRGERSVSQGWALDWALEDRPSSRKKDAPPLHLSYLGLTTNSEVSLGECWVDTSNSFGGQEEWLPRLMVRRRSEQPGLRSDFLGVLQPYEAKPFIISATRGALATDPSRAVLAIELVDGCRQIFVFPAVSVSTDDREIAVPRLETDVEFLFLSYRGDQLERAGIYNGTQVRIGDRLITLTGDENVAAYAELTFSDGKMQVISQSDVVIEAK